MDAARAAAETGLCARLLPNGEIEFNHASTRKREPAANTAEEALEGWLKHEAGRRA